MVIGSESQLVIASQFFVREMGRPGAISLCSWSCSTGTRKCDRLLFPTRWIQRCASRADTSCIERFSAMRLLA